MSFLMITMILFNTQEGDMIELLAPQFTNKSIEECVQKRRSIRGFKDKDLTQQEISNILWVAQGITDKKSGFRTVPSAGATYPLEIFVAKRDGFFRYIPQKHSLKRKKEKDLRKDIAKAAFNQMFIAEAGLVVVITAIFDRTTGHYGKRGIRYVYNEIGHCAQNIHLEVVALGLGSVPIGAYDDEKLKQCCGFKKEEPLYIIPVGQPK